MPERSAAVNSAGFEKFESSNFQPRRKLSPFSRVIIGTIVVAAGISILWPIYTVRYVPVLIVTSDLPALHAIKSTDVKLGTVKANNADEYAGLPVEGRLTLMPVKRGTPLRSTDLSPSMVGAFAGGYVIVGVEVSWAGILGGALSAGDPVQLLISQQDNKVEQLNAIVVSVSRDGGQSGRYSLVVAMNGEDARNHGSVLNSGNVVVIRDPQQR